MDSFKIDMHVHTVYSRDSLIKPNDVITYGIRKGLDGIVICDHESLAAYEFLKTQSTQKNFIIIPGMEIETHIGEVIALFIEQKFKVRDNKFFTVLDAIRDSNGLVLIPHPFDFLRDNHLKMELLTNQIIKKYIDGIEIINSRIIFNRCIKKAQQFNKDFHLFETGGSDAHTKKEIGNGYTLISDVADKSLDSIREALLAKRSESRGKLSSPLVHAVTVLNKLKQGLYF